MMKQDPIALQCSPDKHLISFGVCIFLIFALINSYALWSGDTWFHLATGRIIWEEGRIPHTESLVYPSAGKPVTNPNWLSQTGMYLLYRFDAIRALILWRMAMAGAAVLLFWMLAVRRGAHPLAAGVASLLGGLVASMYFSTRPLMLTPILAAAMLLLLDRPTLRRTLLALLVQALWANLHGSFLIGAAIFGASFARAALDIWRHRAEIPEEKRRNAIRAGLAFAASFLVCAITPFGFGVYHHVFALTQNAWFQNVIVEWKPILEDWSSNRLALAMVPLAWGAVAVGWRLRFKPRMEDILLLVLFTWQMFERRRMVLYFALFSIVPLALALSALWQKRGNARRISAAIVILFIAVAAVRFVDMQYAIHGSGFVIDAEKQPVEAVGFLRRVGVRGRVKCAMEAGGYLEFFMPEVSPSSDARSLENDFDTLKGDFAVFVGKDGWKDWVPGPEESDVMLLHLRSKAPLYTLYPEWAVVYFDAKWVVMMRRQGKYADVVRQHDRTLSCPGFLEALWEKGGRERRDRQIRQVHAFLTSNPASGNAHYAMAFLQYKTALRFLDEALTLREAHVSGVKEQPAHLKQAKSLEASARALLERALKHYNTDMWINPKFSRSSIGKIACLVWLGREEKAERLAEREPDDPDVQFALSRVRKNREAFFARWNAAAGEHGGRGRESLNPSEEKLSDN
jgi:hypothetical protein